MPGNGRLEIAGTISGSLSPTREITGGLSAPKERAGSGDKFFEHSQSTPSSEWHITHPLKKFPSVTVVDSGGSIVVGDIEYLDDSNIIISFQAAFAGKAYLN